jgi:putative oxidoreductase
MKKIASILRLEFLPASTDLGLLVLRLWLGGSLLILHGWGKLTGYQKMASGFADPLKIGNEASLALAIVGEVLCSALLIVGLFTRFAALGTVINMAVAFFLVHQMVLKAPPPRSGEMAFIYLAGFLTILIAGPGRFSLDAKGSSAPKKPRPPKD